MINQMDEMLDQWLTIDLANTTKFKCMKVLRNALLDENFSTDAANAIACNMALEVSDNLYNEYQEQIDGQLAKFAKLITKLFEEVEEEFNMDVNTFMTSFAKDLSFSLEG